MPHHQMLMKIIFCCSDIRLTIITKECWKEREEEEDDREVREREKTKNQYDG